MTSAAPVHLALLRDYRPSRQTILPVLAFWLPWLALRHVLDSSGTALRVLGLSAQFWLAYSAAWWALAMLARRASWSWFALVACLLLTACLGGMLGLPLLADFNPQRVAWSDWAARSLVEPVAVALLLHLVPLALRLREIRRHAAEGARMREKAALADLARQATLAELKTLQAQVEPHFLYNTLAGIQHLVRHDAALADRMLGRLHDYLRLALPGMREPMSTLAREFALADAYLALMQMRLGERLRVQLDLPDELAAQPFPPLMLGSLIENAVLHGIEPKPTGGELRLLARLTEEGVCLSVTDGGIGLQQAAASGKTAGSGLGLSSLRERLRLIYGEAAGLHVGANAQGGVTASISIPLQRTMSHDAASSPD